jgi:hypothetical protein
MPWDNPIGRRLRPKDLHTLPTVAELGSMAKASAALGLSQPAISKGIADLESCSASNSWTDRRVAWS